MVKRTAGKTSVRDRAAQVDLSVIGRQTKAPPAHIANLVIKERTWAQGRGRPLNPTEQAELQSWMHFPSDGDAYLRDLVFKKVLADCGAGPPLSCEEITDLMDSNKLPKEIEHEFRRLLQKNTGRTANAGTGRGRKR